MHLIEGPGSLVDPLFDSCFGMFIDGQLLKPISNNQRLIDLPSRHVESRPSKYLQNIYRTFSG